jgi:hypothetical protein
MNLKLLISRGALLAAIVCSGPLQAWSQTAPPLPAQQASPTPQQQGLPMPKPKIKFEKTVYDFGRVSDTNEVTGTFRFENVGDAALKLEKPITTCGCTVAGIKPEVLQPGEKGELTFNFNLGRTRSVQAKPITIVCNDPESPRTTLMVKADYVPLFEVLPLSMFLGNVQQGRATSVVARATRTDGKQFTVTRIESKPWIQAQSETEQSQSTNQTVRLALTLEPKDNIRFFSEPVNVFVDGSESPAFTISLSGRVVGDLTLLPEILSWPISDPSRAVTTRRVQVKSAITNTPLELKNLTSTLPEVNVQATSKDAQTVEIVATLDKIPQATTIGVIRFETNVPSQPQAQIPVQIHIMKR